MRSIPLILGLAVIVLLAGIMTFGGGSDQAEATHGGPDTLGLDMDVTGNTATSLGTIEDCVSVTAGDQVTMDFFVTNVVAPGPDPADPGGIISWQATFLYPDLGPLNIQSEDQNFLLASNAGSNLLSVSEPTPDNIDADSWLTGSLDISGTAGESGSGVLSRIVVDTTGAATGQYTIVIDPSQSVILDQTNAAFLAHTYAHGAIAVGQACGPVVVPTPPPTPTPAPTPTPPPTASPSPSPTPEPTPTPEGQTPQPTASPTPVTGAGTATPTGAAGTRTATPAALPPTGTTGDGSGVATPLALGAGTVMALVMALGGYEITRRLRREV